MACCGRRSGGMPLVPASRRMTTCTVLADLAMHTVEEAHQPVAVPFFERSAGEGVHGASALVGEYSDVVDKMWVSGPAGWYDVFGIEDVLVVNPGHDSVQPTSRWIAGRSKT